MTTQDYRWLRHEIDGAHEPLSPRESMLVAMRKWDCVRLRRDRDTYKYALMLTWALIAVAAVIAGVGGL